MYNKKLAWLIVVAMLLLSLQTTSIPTHSQVPATRASWQELISKLNDRFEEMNLQLSTVTAQAVPDSQEQVAAHPTYLLWLASTVEGIPEELPAQLTPDFYLSGVRQRIERASLWLELLKSKGRVTSYTPLPDANAIQVEAADEGDVPLLEDLPGVTRVTVADGYQLAAARSAFAAVWEKSATPQAVLGPQATNPSLFVNETYDYVYGYTDPSVPVTVVLKDASGAIKETRTTFADASGYYYVFLIEYVDPRDVVDATAGNNFASLVVDTLTGRVDRFSDRIIGTAPIGRDMTVSIMQFRASCMDEFDQVTFSNTSGSFGVGFPDVTDIINGAYSAIFAANADQNATIIGRYAPVLQVYDWQNYVEGYVEQYTDTTIVLRNASGAIRETRSFRTGETGFYAAAFATRFAVGDRVQVTTGGETLTMPMLNLMGNVNTEADTVSGRAHAAGAPLTVEAYSYDASYGDYLSYCTDTRAGTTSPYPYTAQFVDVDLVQGDYAYVTG